MKLGFIFCALFMSFLSHSQDLKKHLWEDRVLLIFADVKSSELLKNQLAILESKENGLQERKLKVYQFSKQHYKADFNSDWKPSRLKVKKYFKNKEQFKIVLLGLDGGVKLKQQGIISTQKLFAIIDGMPMRKRELNKQN